MEMATYYALMVACLTVLVTVSIKLTGLSKRKSATAWLKAFLQAVFVIVLLIIIVASNQVLRKGEEPYASDKSPVRTDKSEENNISSTALPQNAASESTTDEASSPQIETSETPIPTKSPSVSTVPTELEISQQAYSAYCRWEQGNATEADMESIIAYIDEIISLDEDIAYERIYCTVADVNTFFYVNADEGYSFHSLDELSHRIIAKIKSNQIDNNCGNYCITYCSQVGIFAIQLSMEYLD